MPHAATGSSYNRQWYLKNRERLSIRQKARYSANRDVLLRRSAEYDRAHPEGLKKRQRKYYSTHTQQRRDGCKSWYRRNLARELERNRNKNAKQYLQNRDAILARNKVWRRKNPLLIRLRDARRRALKRQATINLHSIERWMEKILNKRFSRCYFCCTKTSTARIHFDHIVSLATGGAHSVENLCVSCEPCNLSKGPKPVRVWTKLNQKFLEL